MHAVMHVFDENIPFRQESFLEEIYCFRWKVMHAVIHVLIKTSHFGGNVFILFLNFLFLKEIYEHDVMIDACRTADGWLDLISSERSSKDEHLRC